MNSSAARLFLTSCCILFASSSAADEPKPEAKVRSDWRPMFDGKALEGWKPTPFGGEGEVYVEDGRLVLDFGSSMTGVTYAGPFPKSNYEIRYEAMRVDGSDFFCGLTFPVGESHASLIAGGWGGAVVGLSSIDGKDASQNDTTQYMRFETGRWYKFRVRVTDARIQVWIDEKQIIDQPLEGKKISTRVEVNLSKPLGFSTWETRGALRTIEYRTLGEPGDPK
jgi:hypothetical protein